MGFFQANGIVTDQYAGPIPVVSAALVRVIEAQQHALHNVLDDGAVVNFVTKRTALNWGTAVHAQLQAVGSGTQVTFHFDTVPGAPKALLDGKKNRKAIDAFVAQVRAELGASTAGF